MDFEFSDEQRQLRETLERYLSKQYSFDRYRAVRASAEGWDRKVWHQLAELGVLAVNVPAGQGGLGFGPLVTGMLSDLFSSRYGLGQDSLRYAIALSAIPALWGAVHFIRAAHFLRDELANASSRILPHSKS